MLENKNQSEWVQPYRGPFTKKEAREIANELARSKLITGAMVQQRGESEDYDVLIKI